MTRLRMAFKPFELPDTPFHRMRLLATLLLVAMASVFAAASWGQHVYPGLSYVRAFAEASLVGGLADWFAVTALFRHPLGLPIPHTAIIPTNKDRIGDSLAAFLKENFLTPVVMARRMEALDIAGALARWLSAPPSDIASAGRLRRALYGIVARFVGALDDAVVAQLLGIAVTGQLRRLEVAPPLGRFLGALVAEGRHEAIVERLVLAALDFLDANEHEIYAAVGERSGKWVPAWIDDRIAGGIVTGVRTRLLAMSDAATQNARRDREAMMQDFRERRAALEAPTGAAAPARAALGREHPDRREITEWLGRLAEALQAPGSDAAAKVEAVKIELLDSPATAGLFASAWDTIKATLADSAANPQARSASAGRFAAELGHVVTANPQLADALNTLFRRAVVSVVATYGAPVVRLVSDTIRGWNAATVTDKLEAAVGRDLQYIRINGTVIGGLIGLVIHAVERLI
ncbi:MAG: DUF445 domain-containing protein [Janthinobacterium lividum]